MHVLLDLETSDLSGETLWLIVCKDVDSGVVYEFYGDTLPSFAEFHRKVTKYIGHNIIDFDFPVLQKHFPSIMEPKDGLYDTLVVSRLLKFSLDGGHSLEAWGHRLGHKKATFNDFSKFSQEMLDYCRQDVEVTHRFYDFQERFRNDPSWQEAFQTEHRAASICRDMHRTGFCFDLDGARALHSELTELLADLDERILRGFQPKVKFIREVTPRGTKYGTLNANDFRWVPVDDTGKRDLTAFAADVPFSRIEYQEFNPGSPRQMVERLNDLGWQPYEKTKTHIQVERSLRNARRFDKRAVEDLSKRYTALQQTGWKVSENNLNTLPPDAPDAARALAQRLTAAARLSDLEEWMDQYRPSTGRIHGRFLPTGSWTGRMAHHAPNTGNIASEYDPGNEIPPKRPYTPVEQIKKDFDGRMRALYRVPEGCLQVGIDMDAAHLRILAHLIDEPDFTKSLLVGNKSDGTDIHSTNRKLLGDICRTRDEAKTFIYLWLNGGGAAKLAAELRWPLVGARDALARYSSSLSGLQRLLKEDIPRDAARGYFVGIDGRKVAYDQTHGMLAGYLQSAESIILKRTAWRGREECIRRGYDVKLLNLVHDEIQTEVGTTDRAIAEEVGQIFADEYKGAAEYYRLRCPFAGGVSVGTNWALAH